MNLLARFLFLLVITHGLVVSAQPKSFHDLQFTTIPTKWEEGFPVGNGTLGALIWKKGDRLRFSLDNVFLWDDRPMPKIDSLNFKMVREKLAANEYRKIQQLGDEPYEANPAPTKIPGAAIEIDISSLGKVRDARLDLHKAIVIIEWEKGVRLETFVNAVGNAGVFSFYELKEDLHLELVPPTYQKTDATKNGNSVQGQGLEQLGYQQGKVVQKTKRGFTYLTYYQQCTGNHAYEVNVVYKKLGDQVNGYWTIQWMPAGGSYDTRLDTSRQAHLNWWKHFWNASSVSIPDSIIERQYYRDLYKFGSVARGNTPPISLQAIWTADNGRLPPWKGDFHHDLNTQLSYWPGYTSNHLDLTAGFTNWLWHTREVNRKWTRQYFGIDGINVPGVTTISGAAMGGWIQYSMSPTTVAWLAQHFYWQYKYSLDQRFLLSICIPYFKEAEKYLSAMLTLDKQGNYRLPLSSSPEIHDNDAGAWFHSLTNYDLALLKGFYQYCAELYSKQNDPDQERVNSILRQLPSFAVNEKGLSIAAGEDLKESHRHLSPFMAIYPFQLLDIHRSADSIIIDNSIKWIEKMGTREWCGYSFSWMACLYAKAVRSKQAVKMLQVFASNFVSPNSFHLNGDQKNGEYSSYTYRPFTLEGNFAFAQGVHELLLQNQEEVISVFPALPEYWKDVSFHHLRSQNAFLVSARRSKGINRAVTITATQDAILTCRLPFAHYSVSVNGSKGLIEKGALVTQPMKKGQVIIFKNLETEE